MRDKFVYICSPLSGDIDNNIAKAINYCKNAVRADANIIPLAPHIYCTRFLDDTVPAERAAGLDMGMAMLSICSEIWVYGYENPSEGMKAEIQYAKAHGIKIIKKPRAETIYDINRPKPVPSTERIEFWKNSYLGLNQTCPEMFGHSDLLRKLTDLQQQEHEFAMKSDDERTDYYACIKGLQSAIESLSE